MQATSYIYRVNSVLISGAQLSTNRPLPLEASRPSHNNGVIKHIDRGSLNFTSGYELIKALLSIN